MQQILFEACRKSNIQSTRVKTWWARDVICIYSTHMNERVYVHLSLYLNRTASPWCQTPWTSRPICIMYEQTERRAKGRETERERERILALAIPQCRQRTYPMQDAGTGGQRLRVVVSKWRGPLSTWASPRLTPFYILFFISSARWASQVNTFVKKKIAREIARVIILLAFIILIILLFSSTFCVLRDAFIKNSHIQHSL